MNMRHHCQGQADCSLNIPIRCGDAFIDSPILSPSALFGFFFFCAVIDFLTKAKCVQFSAHDSLESGFETYLINDASRGISQEGIDKALESFKQKGGRVVDSSETVHLARA
eukprot:TRINITY_DN163_c0_g2_i3.p1 TRINITY_DN163_c0_g2~~TRINITY_DN163_c0_g2_i3.p1  ORF type:complete len:111 (+),score=22.99 TRINITY_DN163_c0_g2_i3:204-536(+)